MSQDYTKLITSEYQGSPNFLAVVGLLANGAGAITDVIDGLAEDFDLNNAIGTQLDIVGLWVGLSRNVGGILAVEFFGFADDIAALPFGELGDPSIGGIFYELGESISGSATLGDAPYRAALQAKIIANQSQGTLVSLEQALTTLLGVPYQIIDPGTLVVDIILLGPISNVLEQLLTGFDFMPRTAATNYVYFFLLSNPGWSLIGNGTQAGTTLSKAGGVPAWDSAAYVNGSYPEAAVSWTVNDTAHTLAGGLAATITSGSYTDMNYGMATTLSGNLLIYESGVQIANLGPYSVGDVLQVVADGQWVNYLHNGVIVRTTAKLGDPFFPLWSFFSPGAMADNVNVHID